MSDQIEDLIREIAAKHGIAVARDDPILVLQTINNRLLQDSARAQQLQLEVFKEELESLAHRWAVDAKEKAERILNASLTASNEAMTNIMAEGGRTATASLQFEIDAALGRLASPIREIHTIALTNIAASIITMTAFVVALWTML